MEYIGLSATEQTTTRSAPLKAHWGIPDPAGVAGGVEAERAAFQLAYDRLEARMKALVALPVESMTRDDVQKSLQKIAALGGATALARDKGD